MPAGFLWLALALALTAGLVSWQHARHLDPYLAYDRFEFPGYDAYAYLAAAEHPTVFTVAPWGYRVLTPWVVQAASGRSLVRGFRRVTVGALTLAGALVFLYLRRLGYRPAIALPGAAAFALSPPVAEVVAYPFLAEPLTVLIEVAFLLALRAGAGVGTLAALAVLGVSSKEFFILLLPLVWLESRATPGVRPIRRTALVAVPALLAAIALRMFWAPHLTVPLPQVGVALLGLALERALSSWREWSPALLLGGLGPLALVGFCLPESKDLRPAALYMAAATLLPPFFNPVAFFPWDIPRLSIYLLPVAIALGLAVAARIWKYAARLAVAPLPGRLLLERGLYVLAVCMALVPLLIADRYRRVDLAGPRDGPLLLAVCRETLRTAARLERGLEVPLDPDVLQFVWGKSDPGTLGRMRWFLRSGFGERAHYGTGPVRMEAARATVLLPVFAPRPLQIVVRWTAPLPMSISVHVNGHPVGRHAVGAEPGEVAIAVPAEALFRGDNQVTFDAPSPGLRLARLTYRP
jgi:hypothetical protein